ncbi:MAG: hypothetical protein K9J27_07130 [Bacteroidales bacterium]|nr:hypothetical protein [Bacteroidales bacterium]MCF8333549.1 hypothetical protein [Bacteroidales bacterium]
MAGLFCSGTESLRASSFTPMMLSEAPSPQISFHHLDFLSGKAVEAVDHAVDLGIGKRSL